MPKPKLTKILADLVAGRCTNNRADLSGGLTLRYRSPDTENPRHRLLCCRDTVYPSRRELMVIKSALAKNGVRGSRSGQYFTHASPTTGQRRYCCVISWPDEAEARQAPLPLDLNESPN